MNKTEKLLDIKDNSSSFIKNRAFDVIAVGIIVAMTALSLGMVELRTITWLEIFNIVVECIPFYFAATMLSINYYSKGVFIGKSSDKFTQAIDFYSSQVDKLTGEQMSKLQEFCIYYNESVLKNMKVGLLRSVAITWEMYNDGVDNSQPLKVMTKKQLLSLYNRDIVSVIERCKRLKIKGVHPNILLSTINNSDATDLGCSEKELQRRRAAGYAGGYLVSIFAMSLIGVKDVLQWGWMGAFLTLFKILYIACGAYMKYFNGYEDVTVDVVNHIYRKTDILKEFEYWYNNKFKNVPIITSET